MAGKEAGKPVPLEETKALPGLFSEPERASVMACVSLSVSSLCSEFAVGLPHGR